MRAFSILSLTVLLVSTPGCRGLFGDDEGPTLELTGVVWDLKAFVDAADRQTAVGVQGTRFTFQAQNRIEGVIYMTAQPDSVVTAYFSAYEAGADGLLAIAPLSYTRVITDMPPGSRWVEFHNALSNVTRYEIDSDRLHLFYEGETALLLQGTPVE